MPLDSLLGVPTLPFLSLQISNAADSSGIKVQNV